MSYTNNSDNTSPKLNTDTTSTDSWWLPALEFKIGSQVYIKAQFFCTTRPSKKLSNKFLGPYEVLSLPGTHSVTMTSRQSPCCTLSFPHFYVGTSNSESDPQSHSTPTPTNHCQWWTGIWNLQNPQLQDWQLSLCLQAIVSCWTGYEGTDKETSWVPAHELISDFHSTYLAKSLALKLPVFFIFFGDHTFLCSNISESYLL